MLHTYFQTSVFLAVYIYIYICLALLMSFASFLVARKSLKDSIPDLPGLPGIQKF